MRKLSLLLSALLIISISASTVAAGETNSSVELSQSNVSTLIHLLKLLTAEQAASLPGPVIMKSVNFGSVKAGEPFNLTIELENAGKSPVKSLTVSVSSPSGIQVIGSSGLLGLPRLKITQPFAVYKGSPVRYVGLLNSGKTVTVGFRLMASGSLEPGVYTLYITIRYVGPDGITKSERFSLGIPVASSPAPKIIVSKFQPYPNPVPPGSIFSVHVSVKNVGNSTARRVTVSVVPYVQKSTSSYSIFPSGNQNHQSSPVYPAGGEGTIYFGSLPPNCTANGTLELRVKNVEPDVYPVYVIVSYEDIFGNIHTRKVIIGVDVGGAPVLHAYVGNVWMSDGKYYFELDVSNDGKVPARGVTVSVSSDKLVIYPIGQRYIGTVESMDYDSTDYEIAQGSAGRANLTVVMSYVSGNGSFIRSTETVPLILPPESGSGSSKVRYLCIGLAVVLVIVIVLWRRSGGS